MKISFTLFLFLYGVEALTTNRLLNNDLIEMSEDSHELLPDDLIQEEDQWGWNRGGSSSANPSWITTRKAYSGDMCTYSIRRFSDAGTAKRQWNQYKSSSSKFRDNSFPADSRMLFWPD